MMSKTQPCIIVGGGVIGLAIAFELASRGHQITILERGACGGQATGAAAGMLAPYSEIGEDPDDFFTLAHQSLKMYPEWQSRVKEVSQMDFEYNTNGSLHVVFHEADELGLETRLEWQNGWDVQAEIVKGPQLRALEPHLTPDATAAMYYPEEHHLYAPHYVQALKEACLRLGVQVQEHVGEVTIGEVTQDVVNLHTEQQGVFHAERCILATGAWTSSYEKTLGVQLPVFPIRGQICAYQNRPATEVRHMVFSSQGYVVSKEIGSVVCGASEDVAGFEVSTTEKGIQRLKKWSRRLFPYMEKEEPFHQWAGLRPATQDGYPLIGTLPHLPNVLISSGHYRNGILLSPRNATLVADLYEGKQTNINVQLFDPMRFT
ncbi:glycine oxidase ThiO [Caldalkalibacillus salinus]|uniref:glycine oxidase ThiO n=1 Tax=Caldalkalibacillus salinus TaxID=2803787 RepID=UPI001F020DBC|nr:glycine oxidase ThiO [Caldalkalibacillus salinus]